jgi:hypothetical protein
MCLLCEPDVPEYEMEDKVLGFWSNMNAINRSMESSSEHMTLEGHFYNNPLYAYQSVAAMNWSIENPKFSYTFWRLIKAHTDMLRHWLLVRNAVRVRPFALHWLERHAMAKERERMETVANAPEGYDPLQCDS